MSMEIDAGAGIELGPVSFGALVELGAGIKNLTSMLEKIARREEAYQFGAVRVALRQSATSDSAGDSLELGLGGPAYGRIWQINSLVIGANTWGSTISGASAIVYVGSVKTANPPLSNIVDQTGSLPNCAQYSTGQIIVRHPDHLRVVILSPGGTTAYAAGGWATDLPDKREPIEVDR
jgi:hypothetical protein